MMKILVVDNHPIILKFMTQLLSGAGHQVLTAHDGLSALDLLQTFTPDVMFVDLVMPNIDGKKLCRIVRRMPDFDGVRLIILSGIAVEEQIDPRELGADACIAKGTFAQMTRSVLCALGHSHEEADQKQPVLLGHDGMWPRVITQELLAVKRHVELILESIAEGILELSGEGRIVYANPTAKLIFDLPEEALLGKELVQFFPGNDRQRIAKALQERNCGQALIGEDAPVHLNGSVLSVKFLPIVEETQGTIVILNDITEKRRLAEQLAQAHKMEAVGLLAGGIAHDFNNILTAILGNVSLAKMYLPPEDKACAKLVEAEKASLRAKNLTVQLLTFARGGAPVRNKISLPKVIGECCRYTIKNPAVRCETELDKHLWLVDVDKGQISQAIQNLLVNAEQSMPDGGTIRITARNRVVEEESGVPVRRGKYVELALSDQGVGILEEHLAKIFDPYFTTKNRGGGLGLTIAYSIVKNHKGHIGVESKPERGTTFYVYLPAAVEPVKKKSEKKRPASGKGRVLVMDDEKIIREVTGEMLELVGYTVEFAENGETAIERYREAMNADDPFDVVIMDLTVPVGLGGKEAVKQLLQLDPDARAIVASGYSDDPIMSDYRRFGFRGVIRKPFEIDDLRNTLQEVMHS